MKLKTAAGKTSADVPASEKAPGLGGSWTAGGIRSWYRTVVGRQVMAELVQALQHLPEIGWVGAEQPEVLVSVASFSGKTGGAGAGALELATPWPTARVVNGLGAAGDECRYDRIVLLHELERAPSESDLVTQCARLLRPDGKLVVIVTNRASPWAVRTEFSPFGVGRSYSPGQVEQLLGEENLVPLGRQYALFAPPLRLPWRWRWPALWRVLFRPQLPWLGGALLVAARKDVAGMKAMRLTSDGNVVLQPMGVAVSG